MKNKRFFVVLTISVSLCIFGAICSVVLLQFSATRVEFLKKEHRVVENTSSLKEVWSRSNIIVGELVYPAIVATNEGVYFFGKTGPYEFESIIALDALNPENILWRRKAIGPTRPIALFATSSALYSGTGGYGMVVAYNLLTGETLWATQLPGIDRGIDSLYVADDKVYTGTGSRPFVLDANTGKILEKGNFRELSLETQSRPEYFVDTAITDRISFRWDPGYSSIRAIDHDKDVDLWETDEAASNPVILNDIVYFMTTDGELIGVNAVDGSDVETVQFDSPSLAEIAADQGAAIFYVYMMDSKQLFAFKIREHFDN